MTKTDTRRKQLKAWFADKSLPEKEKSYLSQLINGKSSFGERAARRIEADYGMPTGYLDLEGDKLEVANHGIVLTAEELELVKYFRGFPDSARKETLLEFQTRFEKYNQLFHELLASRK